MARLVPASRSPTANLALMIGVCWWLTSIAMVYDGAMPLMPWAAQDAVQPLETVEQ